MKTNSGRRMKTTTKLWIGVGALAVLSPIGLYLSEKLKAGSAWGEWGVDEVKELTGYVPAGLKKLSSLWGAPLPDYAFKGWENLGLKHLGLAYIVSAIVGIGLCVGLAFMLGKILSKKESSNAQK
jgi:cobalt/nickel transport protein